MSTDILAVQRTTTDALGVGATRIRAVYFTAGASAGTITIRDGGASGPVKLVLATPASAAASDHLLLPGNGIRFTADPHVTISNATSVTCFYG